MGLVPEYEESVGKWAAPFIMATINTKNVHRTNFLLGHPYGADFKYDEMMLTSAGETGQKAAHAVGEMLKNPFGAKPPKPGEGPTRRRARERLLRRAVHRRISAMARRSATASRAATIRAMARPAG